MKPLNLFELNAISRAEELKHLSQGHEQSLSEWLRDGRYLAKPPHKAK